MSLYFSLASADGFLSGCLDENNGRCVRIEDDEAKALVSAEHTFHAFRGPVEASRLLRAETAYHCFDSFVKALLISALDAERGTWSVS